jgi:hypothetical protein
LVGIFLINFEHYKKYVVQVSYPEKSRIGRLNKTNFLQIFVGLTMVSNIVMIILPQQTVFLASSPSQSKQKKGRQVSKQPNHI